MKHNILKKHDYIDIIAPGSACPEEHLKLAIEWIEKYHFKARYSDEILKPEHYLSNTDEKRYQQVKTAFECSDSSVIWCLRGGYGSFRLWPYLLKLKKPSVQKYLIGLSDITSLHQFVHQKWNWPSIHAPLLDRIGQGLLPPENETEILQLLSGDITQTVHENLTPLNDSARHLKKIKGVLRGGNLVTFMASLGTPLQPQYQNSQHSIILFFEDIGERGYRVDRLLRQLKMTKLFNHVQAIVFGDFTQSEEKNGVDLVPYTLKNFAQSISIPVFSGVKSGHSEWQRPLFLNTKTVLTGGEKGVMIIHSNI